MLQRREPFWTVSENVNWYTHYGEQYVGPLKKTKNKANICPCNYTPGRISKEKHVVEDTCMPMFFAALFTIAKTWTQPKWPSTEEWIKKIWHTCTMGYHSAIQKDEIRPFAATWGIKRMSRWVKDVRQRRRNIILHPSYLYSTKIWYKWTYLQNIKRLRKSTHGDWVAGIVKDFCKVMYTLLFLKWITNKNLKYSMWNSA